MSDETKALRAAMAKAFAGIEGAAKKATNPHFRSRYADLSTVVDAIKPHLIEHGLWFAQHTHESDGGVCVETIVYHEGGGEQSFGKLFVPATKHDAQGFGSAITYARRYSLMCAFGVPAEDDDGNAASKATPKVESPFLQPMNEAAKHGPDALAEAWKAHLNEPGFSAFWRAYRDELKAAAEMVSA